MSWPYTNAGVRDPASSSARLNALTISSEMSVSDPVHWQRRERERESMYVRLSLVAHQSGPQEGADHVPRQVDPVLLAVLPQRASPIDVLVLLAELACAQRVSE
jgi:hypothetical protein